MKEVPSGKHSTKHRNKAAEVAADDVTIQFGPEITKSLLRLEVAVEGKKDFDSDAFALLRSLSAVKPQRMESTLTSLLMVARETERYEAKTGDMNAGEALDMVMQEMGEFRSVDKGITVRVGPRAKGR